MIAAVEAARDGGGVLATVIAVLIFTLICLSVLAGLALRIVALSKGVRYKTAKLVAKETRIATERQALK